MHPAEPLPEQYVQPAAHEVVGTLHMPALQVALPTTWGSAVQSFPQDPQLCSSPRHPAVHACPGHAASTATSMLDGESPVPVSLVPSTLPVSATLESDCGPLSTGDV